MPSKATPTTDPRTGGQRAQDFRDRQGGLVCVVAPGARMNLKRLRKWAFGLFRFCDVSRFTAKGRLFQKEQRTSHVLRLAGNG